MARFQSTFSPPARAIVALRPTSHVLGLLATVRGVPVLRFRAVDRLAALHPDDAGTAAWEAFFAGRPMAWIEERPAKMKTILSKVAKSLPRH